MNIEKHKDWKSRNIAASLKLHKLDGSWSWKHQKRKYLLNIDERKVASKNAKMWTPEGVKCTQCLN